MHDVCEKIIREAGGPAKLAADLTAMGGERITSQAISQWKQIPVGRVLAIEALTGVSRYQQRPDIFGPEERGAA